MLITIHNVISLVGLHEYSGLRVGISSECPNRTLENFLLSRLNTYMREKLNLCEFINK